MAIKRYTADADNTITNAFESNLSTRATGSNMGRADILEVFHIFGQESSTSQELSRAIIEFPISTISTDRTNEDIPASGSVTFYLRMFNAPHGSSIPRDATYTVIALSQSWQEGYGMDMEAYSNLTYGSTGSNWLQATDLLVAATGSVTAIATANTGMNGKTLILSGTDGTSYTATCDTSLARAASTATSVGLSDMSSAANLANAVYNTLTGALAAGSVPISASWDGSSAIVTLYQTEAGQIGNTHINGTLVDGTTYASASMNTGSVQGFYSGSQWTPWFDTEGIATDGGSFNEIKNASTRTWFDVAMPNGTEDIELDITPLVEDWIKGGATAGLSNHGLCVKLTSSLESSSVSQYTKKFFARGSQYFFKRPIIEARWDSSVSDNRGDFYFSSSIATAADNLNTLYLYNYVRGQLQEIPNLTNKAIFVSLYSGSDTNTTPGTNKLELSVGGDVATAADLNATGGIVSTGIYSASIAVTGTTALTRVFDMWHNDTTEFHTGSSDPKVFQASNYNPSPDIVSSMTNLKPSYNKEEKNTRFRLFTRQKDWTPNVYTKVTQEIANYTIESIYYNISRTVDEFEVVAFGTGSDNYTKLSYDVTGSYFDFDVSILEAGYSYTVRYLYYLSGKYIESKESYKFRVEE
jgi:hypothetical protein